tara:strand:- start:787 stop:1602 length:816 start_codon:yes stop_codon:yes gene_type:complete
VKKIQIYCTSIKYFSVINKLPDYIKPLGLGGGEFPDTWLNEKKDVNIMHLNKYYGELTGFYWIWKNKINDLNEDDFIGFCHYRKLWMNYRNEKKNKYSKNSIFKDLLTTDNKIFDKVDVLQVQPIIFKDRNLLEDFQIIHKNDILEKSLQFLEEPLKLNFRQYLKGNKLFPLNMFIVKKSIFIKYCNIIFPWLEKCMKYCVEKKILFSYNTRLPAFLAERFTSFWFSQYQNKDDLSYARLGKFFLSNRLNQYINPLKIPFTSSMYPTIHNY